MGSWNSTCAVSNLHIRSGQDVVVLMLAKNRSIDSFCYSNALYNLCYVPFYGKYDDYGSVEDCHGIGLNIVVNALRSKLYKFGQGSNSSHDIEVNKENFDISKLFEADHEDRLGIHDSNPFNHVDYEIRSLESLKQEDGGLTSSQQFELDRLASILKKEDDFRQVTHIQIHGDVFRDIKEKWYLKEYVGEGKGNCGYSNSYVHTYLSDIVATIPEYISRTKASMEEMEKTKENDAPFINLKLYRLIGKSEFSYNDICKAGEWIQNAEQNSNLSQAIVDIRDIIDSFKENKDWAGLGAFVEEVLSVMWLNTFMSYTRKLWTKQCGQGSQNDEHLGYKVLSESVLGVLQKEKKECEDENEEIEG